MHVDFSVNIMLNIFCLKSVLQLYQDNTTQHNTSFNWKINESYNFNSFLLLRPPKIGLIHFHCKCLTI